MKESENSCSDSGQWDRKFTRLISAAHVVIAFFTTVWYIWFGLILLDVAFLHPREDQDNALVFKSEWGNKINTSATSNQPKWFRGEVRVTVDDEPPSVLITLINGSFYLNFTNCKEVKAVNEYLQLETPAQFLVLLAPYIWLYALPEAVTFMSAKYLFHAASIDMNDKTPKKLLHAQFWFVWNVIIPILFHFLKWWSLSSTSIAVRLLAGYYVMEHIWELKQVCRQTKDAVSDSEKSK